MNDRERAQSANIFLEIDDRLSKMGEKGLRKEAARLASLFVSVEDCKDSPSRIQDICTGALWKYRAGKLP